MTYHLLPIEPHRSQRGRFGDAYVGHHESPHVLAINTGRRGRRERHKVGYVDATGTCRRVFEGPILPGPYAFAFGLATVIDNHGGTGAEADRNRAAGTEYDVEPGDRLVLGTNVFRVDVDRYGDVTLAHVYDASLDADEGLARLLAAVEATG